MTTMKERTDFQTTFESNDKEAISTMLCDMHDRNSKIENGDLWVEMFESLSRSAVDTVFASVLKCVGECLQETSEDVENEGTS